MDALKNFGSRWLRPRLLCPKLLMGFVVIDRIKVRTKFEVRSFIRSWDNRGTLKLWAVPGYAVQGHPRSLILVPIESAYATSY